MCSYLFYIYLLKTTLYNALNEFVFVFTNLAIYMVICLSYPSVLCQSITILFLFVSLTQYCFYLSFSHNIVFIYHSRISFLFCHSHIILCFVCHSYIILFLFVTLTLYCVICHSINILFLFFVYYLFYFCINI